MDLLREFDAFPKTLDEFRVRTTLGGKLSLFALALMIGLLFRELYDTLLIKEAAKDVVVDAALDETLAVNFDISFPRIKCSALAVQMMDAASEVQSMAKQAVFKLPLDSEGHAVGHAVQQDAGATTILTKDRAQKHHEQAQKAQDQTEAPLPGNSGCGSCYGVEGIEEPFKCCNTCAQLKEAFKFRGWNWQTAMEERFWQCREERTWKKGSIEDHRRSETREETGCQVFGAIFVAKAKGSFHFGASASNGLEQLFALIGLAESTLDVSHRINSLWFGDVHPMAGPASALASIDSQHRLSPPPLEGVLQQVNEPALVQYYVKIISTSIITSDGAEVEAFQYAATEHVRSTHGSGSLPSVHIFFDLPPLRMKFIEKRKTWARYYTNMCAMVGGVYSATSLLDAVLHQRRRLVKASSTS